MRSAKQYILLFFLPILLIGHGKGFAQIENAKSIFLIDENTTQQELLPHLEYLEDASQKLTFEEVSTLEYSEKFKLFDKNKGLTPSAFWFRFSFTAQSEEEKEWLMEVKYPLLDSMEIFITSDASDKIIRQEAGDFYPYSHREIDHRNFVFPIKSKGKQTLTYYVRMSSTSSIDFPATIWSHKAFLENSIKGYVGLGFYYGIVLVMVLYNLFLFFTLKDKNYLYYISIILAIGFFQFTFNGLGYQFLWGDAPLWNSKAISFFIALMGVTLMNFARAFLDIARLSRSTNKVMLVFQWFSGVACILVLLLPYHVILPFLTLLIGVSLLEVIICIVAGVISFRKGFAPARFFLLAWAAFLIGMTAQAFRALGFLPNNFFTIYSAQIGSALEVVLLSIALADRINTMKSQIAQEKLDREQLKVAQEAEKKRIIEKQKEDLEMQVEVRTAEVMQQNHEIQAQRDRIQDQSDKLQQAVQQLSKTNRNIKNSIQYAQRIQNSILPSVDKMNQNLPKDHFIFYKPRDIVSGDFYWLTNVNGYCYLALADCTGHGVPGALMSVIGSSLLSQIVKNQGITQPAQILNELNEDLEQMLSQGVNGLGTSRDGMDLALIRIDYPNRKAIFSGAKMSVFKSVSSELEEIKGDKFPIGGGQYKNREAYTEQEIDLSDASLYFCSDGFLDQFGGKENRKFSKKRFKQLITDNAKFPMVDQAFIFESHFQEWKGSYRQIDDISVLGIRF